MKDLAVKYLNEGLEKEELDELIEWIKIPGNEEKFKVYVRANLNLDMAYHENDNEIDFQGLSRTIEERKRKKVRNLYRTFTKYAALLVAVLTLGYFGYRTYVNESGTKSIDRQFVANPPIILELQDGTKTILEESGTATITGTDSSTIIRHQKTHIRYLVNSENKKDGNKKVSFNKITVPYGKHFEVELADGTNITLNAGTTLRYPTSFEHLSQRNVELNGEAYFQVAKNREKPFIVHTKEMNVRVLGTKFNVSSYKNENNTSAVLIKGSVAVYRAGTDFSSEDLTIKPGEQALFKNGTFQKKKVNVEKYIAWTENKLYFQNDRFATILKELERHYNIPIINKNAAIRDVRYTGVFQDTSLEQILNIFQENTSFDYRKIDNKIIIDPPN